MQPPNDITMPLQLAPGAKNACSPPEELRVLWMYAAYPYPYASVAAEVALLRSPDKAVAHWSPTDRDFKEIVDFEVAAHNKKFKGMASPVKLTNLRSFVAAFSPLPDGKVGRVNIVTHGMPGIIGLSGTIDGSSGATYFGPAGTEDPNLDPEPARQLFLTTAERMDDATFWRQQLIYGWFNHLDKGQQDRNAIKKKLASCAEIHLYACNTSTGGGLASALMKGMANTFNVPVFGFDGPIFYHPTVDRNRITERRITGVGTDEKDAIAHEALGVLHNDVRPQKNKYSPTTPAP